MNNDDVSNDNSEPPHPIIPKSSEMNRTIETRPIPEKKPTTILFSQLGAKIGSDNPMRERVEGHRFSFAANHTSLQPAIPPPFKKQPIPSMESMNGGLGGGLGGFENLDEPLYFNILNKSIERGPHSISQEFMVKNNDEQHKNNVSGMFKGFATPFASNEFGKMFENSNDNLRNHKSTPEP